MNENEENVVRDATKLGKGKMMILGNVNLIICSVLNYGGRVEFSENRFTLSYKKDKEG